MKKAFLCLFLLCGLSLSASAVCADFGARSALAPRMRVSQIAVGQYEIDFHQSEGVSLGDGGGARVYGAKGFRIMPDGSRQLVDMACKHIGFPVLTNNRISTYERFFTREVQLHKVLSADARTAPYVPEFYGAKKDYNCGRIMMESLHDFQTLAAREDFSLEDRLAVVREVAIAVSSLHESGYVHNDICPSNVMFRFRRLPDGSRKVDVRVIDFNVSGRTGDVSSFFGHMGYVSYGVLAGMDFDNNKVVRHELKPATDVYALGLCLAEVITAESFVERTYQATTPYSVSRQMRSQRMEEKRLKFRNICQRQYPLQTRSSQLTAVFNLIETMLSFGEEKNRVLFLRS